MRREIICQEVFLQMSGIYFFMKLEKNLYVKVG